jgi:hypothetical protein
MKTRIQQHLVGLVSTVAFVALAAGYCLGRAGGGGGHASSSSHSYSSASHGYSGGGYGYSSGSSGGDGSFVLLLALLGAVGLVAYLMRQNQQYKAELAEKFRAVKDLTKELSQADPLWNLRKMTIRVNKVFFRVQQAWTERNQELARDCMSDRIYRRHKALTDQMLADKTRNVLENIRLTGVLIYSVADYQDDTRDTFAAQLTGSMVDYTVSEAGGYPTAGNALVSESFCEVWYFVRQENQWVLDAIAPLATAAIIRKGSAYSEG